MNKLFQNKNLLLTVISCVILVAALVIASIAISNNKKNKEAEISESIRVSRIEELASIEAANAEKTTEQQKQTSNFTIGKYKIATKDDPLGMRLEPNTSSMRIIDIPKGETVEVIAVWNDWGYVVYNQSGGWLSMKYLEKVK